MKLPPATTWPSVGLLCLCSCTLPLFVGEVSETSSSTTDTVADVTASSSTGEVVTDPSSEASTTPTSGATSSTGVLVDTDETGDASATTLVFDVGGGEDVDDWCGAPADDCDAEDDAVDHALGLNCAGGMSSLAALTLTGPPEALRVVGQLGATGTYAPRLGARAVLLSTGDAAQVELTQAALYDMPECSQIGLPCPSTDFADNYDLVDLPLPLLANPITCPKGQALPGPGDCSQTVEAQWYGEPRLAHDYSELRLAAEVPAGTLGVELKAAFFSAEMPSRTPVGSFNDFFIVWLESEQWTGNIAIHPEQQQPIAAGALDYDFSGFDPELAGFAFEEHVGMDWATLTAPVSAGETITLVMALFDVSDGGVDSAVLLDDLRWTCAPPTLGDRHP